MASSTTVTHTRGSDLPPKTDVPGVAIAPLRPLPGAPIIPRSAALQAKGPRLQKLRAATFLVSVVGRPGIVQAYAAVEAEGDAFLKVVDEGGVEAYSEENKNYAAERNFTFVSPAVINSLVLCIDAWIVWRYSTVIRFGFYTTADVGKEKFAGRVKDLGLSLPAKPMLELLRANDFSDPQLLLTIKALVTAEYKAQYERHKLNGYAEVLEAWPDRTWITFLGQITWLIAEGDERVCEDQLIAAIQLCPYYTPAHAGKEALLLAGLLDLFDRKQLATDFADKFVHQAELGLLFGKVAATEGARLDPTWQVWKGLEPATDQRNVAQKLTAVCPALTATTLGRYQRNTAAGLVELEEHAQDKSILAMCYQIYDACEGALVLLGRQATDLTEAELAVRIDELVKTAMARIKERASDYGYSLTNETFVRGVVLRLFDSCFLALDQADP